MKHNLKLGAIINVPGHGTATIVRVNTKFHPIYSKQYVKNILNQYKSLSAFYHYPYGFMKGIKPDLGKTRQSLYDLTGVTVLS